jgi:hypothetical protein
MGHVIQNLQWNGEQSNFMVVLSAQLKIIASFLYFSYR